MILPQGKARQAEVARSAGGGSIQGAGGFNPLTGFAGAPPMGEHLPPYSAATLARASSGHGSTVTRRMCRRWPA